MTGKFLFRKFLCVIAILFIGTAMYGYSQHWTRGVQTEGITEMAFSPDGRLLASASEDESVYIYETSTGKIITILEDLEWLALKEDAAKTMNSYGGSQWIAKQDSYNRIQWSPDSKLIFSVGTDLRIRIWNVKTGKISYLPFDGKKQTEEDEQIGRYAGYYDFCLSPDGKSILAVSNDEAITIWNVATLKKSFSFKAGEGWNMIAEWSPDGKTLVTANEKALTVWDAGTRKPLQTVLSPDEAFDHVVWSENGRYFAAVLTRQKKVSVYDTAPWGLAAEYTLSEAPYRTGLVMLDDSGKLLFSYGTSGEFHLTDGATGMNLIERELDFSPQSVYDTMIRRNRAGTVFAVGAAQLGEGSVQLIDAKTGEKILDVSMHNGPIIASRVSVTGKEIMTVGYHGDIRIWNSDDSTRKYQKDLQLGISTAFPSNDLKKIMIASADDRYRVSVFSGEDFSTQTEYSLGRIDEYRDEKIELKGFSADGTVVALYGYTKGWAFFNTGTGKQVDVPYEEETSYNGIRLSENGDFAVCNTTTGTVNIFSTQTGEKLASKAILKPAEFGEQFIGTSCISPDSRYYAVIPEENLLEVYELKTMKKLSEYKGRFSTTASCVFFDPVTLMIAESSGEAVLYNVVDKKAKKLEMNVKSGYLPSNYMRQVTASSKGTVIVVLDSQARVQVFKQ